MIQNTRAILSPTAEAYQDFNATVNSCAIFCEAENYLLLLPPENSSQVRQWGLPGGDILPSETAPGAALRILKELTELSINSDQLSSLQTRFARIGSTDSIIHFFTLNLPSRPEGMESFKWISIFALHVFDQMDGNSFHAMEARREAFAVGYQDRIWKRMPNDPGIISSDLTYPANKIIFKKNDQTLIFDNTRRFVVTLLGTVHSGKTTQGEWLSAALGGITAISDGDIWTAEAGDSSLKRMVAAFQAKYAGQPLPFEVRLGMITNRLSEVDCLAGYILKGFPAATEECKVLLGNFIRERDCFIPIVLDLPDQDVGKRVTISPAIERRLGAFNQSKEDIARQLNERSRLLTLQITDKTPYEDILHQILLNIQNRFDQMAREEAEEAAKGELASKVHAQSVTIERDSETASSRMRADKLLMLCGALCASFIAGGIFYKIRT